jgi:hypothetical protein
MSNGDVETREVSWAERFGFLRLFRTPWLAAQPVRLALCLAGVLACYTAGRVLDRIWLSAGQGALVAAETGRTFEVEAYAAMPARDFEAWKLGVREANKRFETRLVADAAGISEAEAAARLENERAAAIVAPGREQERGELIEQIEQRRSAAIAAIDATPAGQVTPVSRDEVYQSADYLRFIAAGRDPDRFFAPTIAAAAVERLVTADTTLNAASRAEMISRLRGLSARQRQLIELRRRASVGPFDALMKHEIRCIAAAVQGAAAGRLLLDKGANSAEPSMLGSLADGGAGLAWIVTQRPIFAVLLALACFAALAFFGGAVCRMAALHAARDEQISAGTAIRFACQKYLALLSVPILPIVAFLVAGLLLWVGGLFGAIPFAGPFMVGLFYPLALLAGLLLAVVVIASLLGFNLMWPTIAVEGSDGLDAISRSWSYVGQRLGRTLAYWLVLLTYGGLCLLVVRLVVLVALKLAHDASGLGMSVFGMFSSARTDTFGAMQAMWTMPAWADLSILPSNGAADFWGEFGAAPLGAGEAAGSFLMAAWVFLVVGLVAAFAISFLLCGSTQMYLLLRRDVDSTDLEEVFVDDDGDDLFAIASPPPAQAAPARSESEGKPLPIMTQSQPPAAEPSKAAAEPSKAAAEPSKAAAEPSKAAADDPPPEAPKTDEE